MLIKNQICEELAGNLSELGARVVFNDILTYDAKQTPLIVITHKDTEINDLASDSWKHLMSINLSIIASTKLLADELLQEVLKILERYQGIKSLSSISTELNDNATIPSICYNLDLSITYYTPSWRV